MKKIIALALTVILTLTLFAACGSKPAPDDGKTYTVDAPVYRLSHVGQSRAVAVRLDGSCYVFTAADHAPPATLGELWSEVDLPSAIALESFSADGRTFAPGDTDRIWSILSGCRNAPFVEDDLPAADGDLIVFTVSAEELGADRVALSVTADGYLRTNVFAWGYRFLIGTSGRSSARSRPSRRRRSCWTMPCCARIPRTASPTGSG